MSHQKFMLFAWLLPFTLFVVDKVAAQPVVAALDGSAIQLGVCVTNDEADTELCTVSPFPGSFPITGTIEVEGLGNPIDSLILRGLSLTVDTGAEPLGSSTIGFLADDFGGANAVVSDFSTGFVAGVQEVIIPLSEYAVVPQVSPLPVASFLDFPALPWQFSGVASLGGSGIYAGVPADPVDLTTADVNVPNVPGPPVGDSFAFGYVEFDPSDDSYAVVLNIDLGFGVPDSQPGGRIEFGGPLALEIRGILSIGTGGRFQFDPPCPADVNGDGEATSADFFAWVNAFGNQSPECDVNRDTSCDSADFFAWVQAFGVGC